MRRGIAVLVLALAAPRHVAAAAVPTPAAVQKAIDSGNAWLRAQFQEAFADEAFTDPVELVVLTLAHTGANAQDPVFAKGLALLQKVEPRFTYRTALLAMALSEVNPRLHRA